MIDIDHEQDVGQRLHFLDAAEASLELVTLASEPEHLFLRQALETTFVGHLFERHQALYGLTNGLVVGQHSTEPALAHERHLAANGVVTHRVARRTFGSNEQHLAAVCDRRLDECAGLTSQGQALLEVNDVDFVAFTEDEGCHLRVPVAGLMPKMHASL